MVSEDKAKFSRTVENCEFILTVCNVCKDFFLYYDFLTLYSKIILKIFFKKLSKRIPAKIAFFSKSDTLIRFIKLLKHSIFCCLFN